MTLINNAQVQHVMFWWACSGMTTELFESIKIKVELLTKRSKSATQIDSRFFIRKHHDRATREMRGASLFQNC